MYYVIYSVEVLELFFNKLNTAFIKEDRSERESSSIWKSPPPNFANKFLFLLHEELVHGLGKRPEYFLRQFPTLHFSRIRRAHDASESILRLFSKSFCTI